MTQDIVRRGVAAPLERDRTVGAARRLNQAGGMLAASVLADSSVEHYRGCFENRAMYLPLVSSSLSLAASLHGTTDWRGSGHWLRDAIYALAGLTGVAGTGFHLYNIGKREGGWSWINLFYAAPIGAPMALSLSGLMGFLSERLRRTAADKPPRLLGFPAGRTLTALTGAGLAGTVGEAGLLHFRGAFQNPAMVLPVTVPPIAAALLEAPAAVPWPAAWPSTGSRWRRWTPDRSGGRWRISPRTRPSRPRSSGWTTG